LYFDLHDHNIDSNTFERFVRWLRQRLRRPLILVLDRWQVHRSAVRRLVDRFGRSLVIEWLPPYAPELNPVEQVWSHTKYGDLANYIPEDVATLADEVLASVHRTASSQSLLRAFFKHAELEL
jgi:transposase